MIVKILSVLLGFFYATLAAAYPTRTETISFRNPSGLDVQAEVIRPADLKKDERLPTVMVFGGFETKGVLALLHPKERMILAAFDYLYTGSRQFEFPKTLAKAPALKRAAHETLDGILSLSRLLRDRPDVDPENLTLVGASFGAPFAVYAAAEEPAAIRRLVLVHGFADLKGTMRHRLEQIMLPKLGFLAPAASWLTSELIIDYLNPPYPEEEIPRLRPEQKVLMIEAKDDHLIPLASRELLWRSLQTSPAKSERIVMPGDHLQPGSDALIAQIMEIVAQWMRQ